MSKIIGVTVGTPISPTKIKEKIKPVTSVNGVEADENGNVLLNFEADKQEIVAAVLAALPAAEEASF